MGHGQRVERCVLWWRETANGDGEAVLSQVEYTVVSRVRVRFSIMDEASDDRQ